MTSNASTVSTLFCRTLLSKNLFNVKRRGGEGGGGELSLPCHPRGVIILSGIPLGTFRSSMNPLPIYQHLRPVSWATHGGCWVILGTREDRSGRQEWEKERGRDKRKRKVDRKREK